MTDFYGDRPATVTFGQAAARLGLDVNLIRRWVRTEQAPVIIDGRLRRIPARWVDEQLALSDRAGK